VAKRYWQINVSEKKDKRRANRKLRRRQKIAVRNGKDLLPIMREVSDLADFVGDRW